MKILVIGCGSIGARHARIISQAGGHELYVCDSDRAFAEEVMQKNGAARFYLDYNQAIADSGAQAAVVCTPNHMHAAPTIAALRGGMHVLCEKPASDSAKAAREMADAAKAAGRILFIGYTMRVNKTVIKIKELLSKGALGKICSARVVLAAPETLAFAKTPFRKRYETGGGIIYDYSHEIDYCRHFFGEADKCVAFVELMLPHLETCDDNAAMLVRHKSGITVTYHMDYIQEAGPSRGRSIAIVCEKGFIETNFSTSLTVYRYSGDVESYSYAYERDDTFADQLKLFERVTAGEPGVYCSGEDGYEIIRLCDALYKSAADGCVVSM